MQAVSQFSLLIVNEVTYMLSSFLLGTPVIVFTPLPPSPPTLQPTYPRNPTTHHTGSRRPTSAQPPASLASRRTMTPPPKRGNTASIVRSRVTSRETVRSGRSSAPVLSYSNRASSCRNSEIERCNSWSFGVKRTGESVRDNCCVM